MANQIQIGVIGTSWWADTAHLPLLKLDPRVSLTAICGRNRGRAQEMATKYGISHVYTDYKDMIANGNLQAIVISTPDDEHYDMTMTALDAGLHVLCEKPLALNAADAKAMYEKAKAKDLRHMAFFTWRWMPHYRYMRELIQEGILGRIYHVQLTFLMAGGRAPKYQWRFDPQRSNGVLGDSGSHMFDLARHLVGDISRVNARLVSNVRRVDTNGQPMNAANDAASIMIEFVEGAHGTVEVSMVTRVDDPGFEQNVTVYGETGTLIGSLKLMQSPQVRLARNEEDFQTLVIPPRFLEGVDLSQPFAPQFESMFTHQPIGCHLFVDAILAKQTLEPSFYEGWKSQQIIDAAIASHQGGQWVAI